MQPMRVGLLLGIALWLWLSLIAAGATSLHGLVSWVDDGDSLRVEGIGKVRLLGIDSPEYQASSRDDFYVQNFAIPPSRLRRVARQAKRFNIEQAKGRRVRLELDRDTRDRHGRMLAYVYLPDGSMLNRRLLRQGLASVFRRYAFRYKTDFLDVERTAREEQLGLWEP